jgi:hypothetical protein
MEHLMAATSTRWNLVLSKETDKSLRKFLGAEGGGKKGDLSRSLRRPSRSRSTI